MAHPKRKFLKQEEIKGERIIKPAPQIGTVVPLEAYRTTVHIARRKL